MPRFALLEHTGAPDDPAGLHFDLLLEGPRACRTWRLVERPLPDGPAVAAHELAPHRLAWLDCVEETVSGGRGIARRVDSGTFAVVALDADTLDAAGVIVVAVSGATTVARMRIEAVGSGWAVSMMSVPPETTR
jgi:hypothetical protein